MKTRIEQNEPNDPLDGAAPAASTNRTIDAAHSATAPTNGFRAFVRRYELVIFFALSYLIGWSMIPFGTFLAFAPLLSMLIVLPIAEGLPGLARLGQRILRWRVNWMWYAAAIILPLVVQAVGIGLNMASGAPAPSIAQLQPWYTVLLVFGLRMINPTDGPLGEEPAWRGFAQPRFQSKWSPLASAAVLGLLITAWHMPLVVTPQFDLGFPDIATTVVVTFWYAWLFNRTGGSVLLTLIAHVTEGTVKVNAMWSAGPYLERLSWTYLLAWTLLVVALLIFDPKSWRAPPESAMDKVPGRIA